ncbi:MAG: SRPBCC family protein [Desulfurococcales archaeon]|nr:SRPBCC family protein [Desulfurococcales archaeon]
MARLRFRVEINAPVDRVFGFIADGVNAPKWHPSIVSAERIEGTVLGVGSTVRYRARVGPLDLIWVTRAVEFEWNRGFRDVMVRVEKGPLAWYELTGIFKPGGRGTLVEMELDYRLSWGPIGPVLDSLVVARRISAHMHEGLQKAKKLLESGEWYPLA